MENPGVSFLYSRGKQRDMKKRAVRRAFYPFGMSL